MAEINIEKKNNKPVWPWILVALLIIGIIWAFTEMGDDTEDDVALVVEDEEITNEPESDLYAPDDQADFVAYVNNTEIQAKMGLDHIVTASALMKLSFALEDLAQGNASFSDEINELRENAKEIKDDPYSLKHADKVSVAFTSAVNLLGRIQQANYPDAQSYVEEVKEKTGELKADEQLLHQKEKVKEFFTEAADAVEKMKEEKIQ